MIPIYLCDDEAIWLERISNAIADYQIKSDWPLAVAFGSTSPEEFLSYLEKNAPEDSGIFFLDIDLKSSINGLDIASVIRSRLPYADIVIVTTHDEMVMDTFQRKLSVLDFIVKDGAPLEEQIISCLDHIETRYHQSRSMDKSAISILAAGHYHTILPSEIYFVESVKNSHKVRIHLRSDLYSFTSTLAAVRERLGDDFIQCHKTCVVNVRHIKELIPANYQILLDNGEVCFGSVRVWRSLKEKYQGMHR